MGASSPFLLWILVPETQRSFRIPGDRKSSGSQYSKEYRCPNFFYHFEVFDMCAIDFCELLTNGFVTALTKS
jgi:hypothetical protein